MRTPKMNQDSAQSAHPMGLQPTNLDRTSSRRRRSNSIQGGSDKEGPKSPTLSSAHFDSNPDNARYNRARGPINDAVHSALDPIDPNHTAIAPEVIDQIASQITANVLEKLKASQFSPPPEHTVTTPAEHMDAATSSIGGSPPLDRDKVYTPPSPYRASEEAATSSQPTSPRRQHQFPPPPSDLRGPPSPPFSYGTLSEDSDAKDGRKSRPKTQRISTGDEPTVLEKMWGDLFDERGNPTIRLSQFLKGIAVHLIEDYEPKHSLIVTPAKLQKYYEETKTNAEIYPWQEVFDDERSSLSRMYRDVRAEHHLFQERLQDRPDIPGLTPKGFETWMMFVLKAHPDEEFERLAYTATHMPVNNPDDKKERFPKELKRRQFPTTIDHEAVDKLQRMLWVHCKVKSAHRDTYPADQDESTTSSDTVKQSGDGQRSIPTEYNLSQTTTRSSIPDIDRNVLRAVQSEAAVEDDPNDNIPPPQIERERKPYRAQPGGGKLHGSLDATNNQPDERRLSYSMQQPPKLERTRSLNGGQQPVDPRYRPSQPIAIHQRNTQAPPSIEVPSQSRQRTGSRYHQDQPRTRERYRSPSNSRTTENPHRSGDSVNYGSYHASGSADYQPSSRRSENRAENRYEPRASFSNEPRASLSNEQREREPRQRHQSVSTSDGQRYYPNNYPNDDEYYRTNNTGYNAGDSQYPQSQYPPTSYRGRVQ